MITDTHAHLYYPEIMKKLDEIILRAQDKGVDRIIVPAVDIDSSRMVVDLANKYEIIYCAVGIHPCEVNNNTLDAVNEIEKLIQNEKVVAIGEIGLDYYWDASNSDQQKEFFSIQLELGRSYELPVIIHTRNSLSDAIKTVKDKYSENLRGQFHCFSGNLDELKEILLLKDFFISYCGNITYKNFAGLELIKNTPGDRLLSETDSPFLPPVPYRGKTNEPSFITHTLMKISEINQIDYGLLLNKIENNVTDLFFRK